MLGNNGKMPDIHIKRTRSQEEHIQKHVHNQACFAISLSVKGHVPKVGNIFLFGPLDHKQTSRMETIPSLHGP